MIDVNDPKDLIIMAAEMLNWRIAIPAEDEDGNIHGLIIGTQTFIEEEALDVTRFDIMVSGSEGKEKI